MPTHEVLEQFIFLGVLFVELSQAGFLECFKETWIDLVAIWNTVGRVCHRDTDGIFFTLVQKLVGSALKWLNNFLAKQFLSIRECFQM